MQKDNSLKTAIIAGNHKIENGHITFDQKAWELSFSIKNNDTDVIVFVDNFDPVEAIFNKKINSVIRSVMYLTEELYKQMKQAQLVLCESAVKRQMKNRKEDVCLLFGRNAFRGKNPLTCSCWALVSFVVILLFENGYQKVIFFTSPDSSQLKVSDAIKMQQFFQNHNEYKDRFELIWVK